MNTCLLFSWYLKQPNNTYIGINESIIYLILLLTTFHFIKTIINIHSNANQTVRDWVKIIEKINNGIKKTNKYNLYLFIKYKQEPNDSNKRVAKWFGCAKFANGLIDGETPIQKESLNNPSHWYIENIAETIPENKRAKTINFIEYSFSKP